MLQAQRGSGDLHSWGMRKQPLLIATTYNVDVLTECPRCREGGAKSDIRLQLSTVR